MMEFIEWVVENVWEVEEVVYILFLIVFKGGEVVERMVGGIL